MFAASKSARSAAAGDNKFNYVTLLLNGDGTNGKQNNTFLDGSTNNFTITRNGTPTQGSFSPYGDLWSNYFNGSSYLNIADNAALQVAAGDFTIEAWVFPTSLPSAGNYKVLWSKRTATTGYGGTLVAIDSSGNFVFFIANSSTTWGISGTSSGQTVSLNTWQHLAMVRSGNNLILYKNGVAGSTVSLTFSVYDSGALTLMAGTSVGDQAVDGYMSNFRLVKGTAVYTGTFTPSTTPLTAITNTSLLTCQSNRFRDASSNNFTITANGSPSVQRFSPFEPSTSYTPAVNGGNGYFKGSGDYLTAGTTASNFLCTGSATGISATFEAWVYPTAYNSGANVWLFSAIHSKGNAGASYFNFGIANGAVRFYWNDGAAKNIDSASTSDVPLNRWTHVAITISGTTVKIYVNGVLNTTSTAFTGVAAGGLNSSENLARENVGPTYFTGYISDYRLNNSVVYTSAFTPTTAPLTAITNTSLLLNYTNAGISDAAAANDVTTVGDAQVSTTQVKYGTASMKFDGTGDYLTLIDSPNLQLMAGDFTIEGWIYLAANGVAYGIVSKGTATTGWSVNVTLGNKLQFSYTLSNLTGATSLSASTWYHFAVVRSGTASGNLKVYLNGVADATSAGAVTDTFNQTSTMYIGADRIATSQLNGYIDDLRITKGHARYTTTFTPPTAALPTF